MKRKGQLFVAILLSSVMSACSACKTSSPQWNTFSLTQLCREVETNSKPDQVWNYCGSDSTFHYFFRDSGRMFIGRRFCCKILKNEYTGISVTDERPFTGEMISYSFAFSKRTSAVGRGFTHSVSRGLVGDILKIPD